MHKFTHAKAWIWSGQTLPNPSYLQWVISLLHKLRLSIPTHVVIERTSNLRQKTRINSSITSGDTDHSGNKASELDGDEQSATIWPNFCRWYGSWTHGQEAEWIPSQRRYSCGGETKNSSHCRKLNTRAAFSDYLLPYHHRNKSITTFKAKFLVHFYKTDPYLLSIADSNEKFTKEVDKDKTIYFPTSLNTHQKEKR